MPTTEKYKHLPGITVGSNFPDLSNDPFVLKMAERARELITKYPIPKNLWDEEEEPVKKEK